MCGGRGAGAGQTEAAGEQSASGPKLVSRLDEEQKQGEERQRRAGGPSPPRVAQTQDDQRRELRAGDTRQAAIGPQGRMQEEDSGADGEGGSEQQRPVAPGHFRLAQSAEPQEGGKVQHELSAAQVHEVSRQETPGLDGGGVAAAQLEEGRQKHGPSGDDHRQGERQGREPDQDRQRARLETATQGPRTGRGHQQSPMRMAATIWSGNVTVSIGAATGSSRRRSFL